MTQAVVLFPLPQFEYRAYAVGDVVDFGADDLTFLKQRRLVDDTATVVAAAIAGGKVPKTHTDGVAPALVPAMVDESTKQFTTPAAHDAVRNVKTRPAASAMFILPGRQFAGSGNIKDLSGNGADAVLGAGLTDAQAWAVGGYYSGNSATNGFASVPLAKSSFDLCAGSVIFATVMNMAAPGASQAAFGNGSVAAGAYGFYLSVRATNGKLRPVINVPGGVVSGLSDSTAAFADGADHHVLVAFDFVTGEVKLFRDGALSDSYAANSYVRTGGPANAAQGFGLLGSSTTGYAGKAYGSQLYYKTGVGLPANLAQIAAKLAASPASFLTDSDLDW